MAAIAADQHGVMTRVQVLSAGLTPRQIQNRVERGQLRLKQRGVYILGHLRGRLEPRRATQMAAVLACGPGALVSHGHAAAMWELAPRPLRSEPVHVLLPPGRTPTRRPGIVAHRGTDLEPGDAATADGVPVTSPLRTLGDFAGMASSRQLERAIARAERNRLVKVPELEALVDRWRGRPGAPLLRAIVNGVVDPAFTRSEAEERFLALIRGTGLPHPRVNTLVLGVELDFYWPKERVAVEIDGFAYHDSRTSFDDEHRRDGRIIGSGITVLRFTWGQIVDESGATLVTLTKALTRAAMLRPNGGG